MYKAFKYSLTFHAILIAVLLLKLPSFPQEPSADMVVTVDIVKTSEITNLKNTSKAHAKKKSSLAKKAVKKRPPASKKKKNIKAQTSKTPPKIKKISKAKNDKKEDDLDSLLKDLEGAGLVSNKDIKSMKTSNSSTKPYNENIPLTISEKDNIKIQIEKKFVNPVVLDFNPKELVIKIKLTMNQDGTIEDAVSLNSSVYPKKYSNIFNTLRNALIRASHVASPIVGMPIDKYEGQNGWKEIELSFDAYYLMHVN